MPQGDEHHHVVLLLKAGAFRRRRARLAENGPVANLKMLEILVPHARVLEGLQYLQEYIRTIVALTQRFNSLTLKGSFSAVSKPKFASKYV